MSLSFLPYPSLSFVKYYRSSIREITFARFNKIWILGNFENCITIDRYVIHNYKTDVIMTKRIAIYVERLPAKVSRNNDCCFDLALFFLYILGFIDQCSNRIEELTQSKWHF